MKLSEHVAILNETFEEDVKNLQKVSGNAKKELLGKLTTDDKLVKEILFYAYNPHMKYNIAKIPDLKFSGKKKITGETWSEYKKLLNSLYKREITGHEALNKVKDFLSKFNEESGNILFNIMKKDLRIGLDASTINKVFPKLIPEFGVTLAKKYEINDEFKLPFNGKIWISRKLDGIRMITIKNNDVVECYSRNGKLFPHFEEIKNQIRGIKIDNKAFDGEVAVLSGDAKDNFQSIISMARTKEKSLEDKSAVYLIFDCLDADQFFEQKQTKNFSERYENLKKILGISEIKKGEFIIPSKYPNLFLVNQISIDKSEQLKELFEISQKKNFEGLMMRTDVPYEFKRTKNLLKMKTFQDDEFRVVSMKQGTGQFSKTLGAFVVEVEDKGKKAEVDCGSGLTPEERDWFWSHKKEVIGKKITIKYFEKTTDQNGKPSLRFPIFKAFDRESIE